ncbi:hypothetical protein [Streptomyces rubradiris]|uniref:Uncharacterized protein n=1 Tax=Streptomyces rubradiris TaxID=285531 RepID=A0ABQ3R8V4_STRRR|nr:hypothetical protein [Streptomyces rubradiris]GHH29751.1 hypothetical protein GCM10018792_75280 [Streptomyces rubradiris]GHI52283.1 hypothetical protein Srubr_21290 [Streptomyces rubradiris]
MSDYSVTDPSRAPDFLDRLITRHTATAPDSVRVRPRLPGPFERVEAVRPRTPEPDPADTTWPATTHSAAPERDGTPPATEIHHHTEHRTVVRTEPAFAATEPGEVTPTTPPGARLPRPAVPLTAAPHPAPRTTARGTRRPAPETGADRTAASAPASLATGTAPTAVVPTAARPGAADTTAARTAVRQSAGRRAGRAPEQVVRVQIGRLEVTAAQPPARTGSRPGTGPAERPGATLSLADYLARERE